MSADCRLNLTVREPRDERELDQAMRLRVRVFCDEQGVSREEELDEHDATATHLVAVDEKGVVATCRLRFAGEDCKLERMAVDARHRGRGAGARLLEAAERVARERGASRVVMHAQTRARAFYASRGYEAEGDLFTEAGIEHVLMSKGVGGGGPA